MIATARTMPAMGQTSSATLLAIALTRPRAHRGRRPGARCSARVRVLRRVVGRSGRRGGLCPLPNDLDVEWRRGRWRQAARPVREAAVPACRGGDDAVRGPRPHRPSRRRGVGFRNHPRWSRSPSCWRPERSVRRDRCRRRWPSSSSPRPISATILLAQRLQRRIREVTTPGDRRGRPGLGLGDRPADQCAAGLRRRTCLLHGGHPGRAAVGYSPAVLGLGVLRAGCTPCRSNGSSGACSERLRDERQ
jgi:hypothetical protein